MSSPTSTALRREETDLGVLRLAGRRDELFAQSENRLSSRHFEQAASPASWRKRCMGEINLPLHFASSPSLPWSAELEGRQTVLLGSRWRGNRTRRASRLCVLPRHLPPILISVKLIRPVHASRRASRRLSRQMRTSERSRKPRRSLSVRSRLSTSMRSQLTSLLSSCTAKAIELFLASLVESCVKDAEERGSKKLTPYGLCALSLIFLQTRANLPPLR